MPDGEKVMLTRSELRAVVAEGVHDAFLQMGMDSNNPIEMQKDFQHLRDWREASGTVRKHSITVLIGIIITGSLGAMLLGIKSMMSP